MLPTNLSRLPTPCLLIEHSRLQQNIARLSTHIGSLGCVLRPHVKTHKSADIAQEIVMGGNTRGITVSTLKEAHHFFQHGFDDILYAVGIVPNKFAEVKSLLEQGCNLTLILDSLSAAEQLADYAKNNGIIVQVLIEIDVDNHRAGVDPKSDVLLQIAQYLHEQTHTEFRGVMTHAGGSYECFDKASQLKLARQERDLSVLAAERIRRQNIECPVVSIGSTPTAFAIDDLTGITEVRAGVYVLFDLVMAGLGVCEIDDIAVSVLGSIIGFQHKKQIALSDAGWMAMSRDRGTADHRIDQAYGVICNQQGEVFNDLIMQSANQEHGIIGIRGADNVQKKFPFERFQIGDQVRILPNHACATAAQFDHFYLVDGERVLASLPSITGW